MKLHTEKQPVIRGGVSVESQLQIKASAEAFEILSSGLYTDSVNAVVRELSANAYDSHVAAGNPDKPFDIHIPSRLDPYFYIRDYGTGLSHDQVLGLYSTYFESTKDTSDDFIGAMGLGSKTPFSYTQNYQVTSWFNGVEYKYAVFVNENGVPSVALMAENITDQPNGLEVRINSEEGERFLKAVSWYLAYFKVKPNVLNIGSYDSENLYSYARDAKESALNEDGKWFMASDSNRYSNIKIGAVYGQVPYPVNKEQIIDNTEQYLTIEAMEFYKNYANDIVFIFDIGALRITANREELKYNEHTLKSFAARITEMYTKFDSIVTTLVENFEHNDSVYKTVNYLYNDVFNRNDAFFRSLDLNAVDCEAYKQLPNYMTVNSWGISWNRNIRKQLGTKTYRDKFAASALDEYYGRGASGLKIRNVKTVSSASIAGNIDYKFYIIDEARGGIAKVKEDYLNITTNYNVVLSIPDIKNLTAIELEERIELARTMLGGADITRSSTLAPAPSKPRATSSGAQAMGGTVFGYTTNGNLVVNTEFDFSQGGVYFFFAGGKRAFMGSSTKGRQIYKPVVGSSNMQKLLNVYNNVSDTDLGLDSVYGVSAADIKKFDKASNWVNIFDVVNTEVEEKEDHIRTMVREFAIKNKNFATLQDNIDYRFNYISGIIHELLGLPNVDLSGTTMGEAFDFVNEKYNAKINLDDLDSDLIYCENYLSTLNIDVDPHVNTDDIDSEYHKLVEAASKKYPLLQNLSYNFDITEPSSLQMVTEYIKMVEQANQD